MTLPETEEVEIKIKLSSEYWEDRFPGAQVYINKSLIHDSLIIEPTEVRCICKLTEGKHDIVVKMYNKQETDTVVDDAGNIVKDTLLNIDSVTIDDIELGPLIHSESVYFPLGDESPMVMLECTNLGWNGEWVLQFSTPTYLWFLEKL